MQLNYDFLLSVFIFGMLIAAVIGPVAIIIINISTKISLRSGIMCALGASVADLTCAAIAFFLYSSILVFISEHKEALSIASSVMLIALGLYISISAMVNPDSHKQGESKNFSLIAKRPFIMVYLLTMVSPMMIPLFTAFIGKIDCELTFADKFVGTLVLFFASLAVQLLMAVFANSVKKYILRGNVLRYFNIVCGLGLALYGLKECLM